MRALILLGIGALLAWVIHHEVLRFNTLPVVLTGKKEPTRRELRKAMKYHGILFASEDENGEWWFERDGKRVKLFQKVR